MPTATEKPVEAAKTPTKSPKKTTPAKRRRTSAITTDFVEITPQMAAELLEHNSVNRRIRPRQVAAYAEDMARGLWRLTGEAIKVSRSGQLQDGQHRLNAIIDSGQSVRMLLIKGLEDEAQALMDQGANRTATDAARMAGYTYASHSSSIARWLLLAPTPNPNMEQQLKAKASTAQILKTLEDNPDIPESAAAYSSLRNYLPGSPTAIGYTWLQMRRKSPEDCTLFFASFVDLSFKALYDPRKAAIRRLQAMDREPGARSSKDKGIATVSVLIRAWNAWRAGEELESINAYTKNHKIIAPVSLT